MGKTVGSPPTIIEQLQAASERPLSQRFLLMEDILKTVSPKDLRQLFPVLLHEIFDFEHSQYSGWRLDSVCKSNHPELFQRIQNFMGPEGLLMKLIHKLQGDPYAQYEFPVQCLPAPAKHMIGEGAVPPFYANKLQVQSSSATGVLILTAFELYMFHLAYALVSPSWQGRNESWPILLDFVYPAIINDMLVYFFPCDKKSLPSSPQFNCSPVRAQGPLNQSSIGYGFPAHQQLSAPFSPNTLSPQRTLFKSSFINAQKQHQQNLPHLDQAETEAWQSETFLQILAEFWLNQNSGPGVDSHPISSAFQEHFMPSINHVKLVRLLVKYLHQFANSATSLVTSSYQQAVMSPLDQFKRLVIPFFLQKKLYTFLRHAFERWPLDSCFRMVLETWLSYIQPWRYVDLKRSALDARVSETDLHGKVDDKWDQFVENNLLFYSVLLAEFLPRIHRMDLTSPYSAYMVYRVSRIFSLPNLASLIYKAELETFGSTSRIDLGESYLSTRTPMAATTLPSQIIDFEGPNFMCPQFFSEGMVRNIILVIDELRQALSTVRLQQEDAKNTKQSRGFFAFLFGSSNNRHLESTPEFRQLPVHLENSVVNFCNIFNIPLPPGVASSSTSLSGSSATSSTSSSTSLNLSVANDSMYLTDGDKRFPHCVETEQGLKLTNIGRSQLINRECRFNSFDTGDPDLLPVRSYEIATLVRLLFHLCFFINSYFKSEFTTAFSRTDFVGHFARMFLTAPLSAYQSQLKSPRTNVSRYSEQSNHPRISLRFLANYYNLLHLFIVYFLCSLTLGTGVLGFSLLLLAVLILYGLVVTSFRYLRSKPSHVVR